MASVRARLVIAGLVQGVYFRDSTRRIAEQHGVRGWVRNLPDGAVEAVLEGERVDVAAVIEWCRTGPSHAVVEDVRVQWEEATGQFDRFAVR